MASVLEFGYAEAALLAEEARALIKIRLREHPSIDAADFWAAVGKIYEMSHVQTTGIEPMIQRGLESE